MSDAIEWLQLPPNRTSELQKNKQLTVKAEKIVTIARSTGTEFTRTKANLLLALATKLKSQWEEHLPLVIKHICNEKIRTEIQLASAVEYLLSHIVSGVNEEDLKKAFGCGVVVSQDEIEDTIKAVFEANKEEMLKQRYSYNFNKLLSDLRQTNPLKWADGVSVKREVDLQVIVLLGPKTEEELAPQPKKKADAKKEKAKPAASSNGEVATSGTSNKDEDGEGANTIDELMKTRTHFHEVGKNFKTDGYVVTPKTMELLKKHVEVVGGKVQTRFPPEPNGILHIGHAKAININFGYAKAMGGVCYLRFDDTNPEKEEEKFFKGIEDIVKWLGYTPYKITHSSDYFDQLYQWAEELILKDLAYVCHMKVEEMRGFEVKESPWRNRPVEESLALFRDMKHGKFDEGAATLRLKHILEEGKVDPVAYRIKFLAHHRTGNKWCIYPTYDYTHCLCDSIENITHSLCTKEFQSRRSSYYWLCNSLDIYCPVQWEYGRLNLAYTVVSKRKILKLVDSGIVKDWDDPRLFTLTACRRRGIPAEAINKFVARLGVSVARAAVKPHLLDAVVRDHLNNVAPRTMAVLEPLKLTIENFDEFKEMQTVEVPDFPADPNSKKHKITFDRVIYIELDDYRSKAGKDFRRLTDDQPVGLKYVGLVINVTGKDGEGNLLARAEHPTAENKPKAFIHWVARPIDVEIRLYESLFKHENPEDKNVAPGGFLSDLNENTLKVYTESKCDAYVKELYGKQNNFQFERVGFFAFDPDTTDKKLVFNRTVSLREDGGKGTA
ncbi:Glutaminyl-tRNA synthetase [Aphelenchoides bicaudatus]|nr:Glutaminyl-tRNA synthetase [Aphelenchoides bicaudatus]